jgi:hypothetical protein
VKTNVDLISPQENALLNKSKENQKNIKEEKNKSINSPKNSKFENNEKNKEDENKNDNKENNENIILEKVNNEKNDNIKNEDNINDIIKNVLEEKKEVDPLLSYINSNRKISEEEIKNSPKLILEEIDGNLFNGKKIEINAGGMVEGRNKKDGFTIFGQKIVLNTNSSNLSPEVQNNDNNNNNEQNDKIINDFELNYPSALPYPYIFAIYYKKEEKAYYIRAYSGKGSDNKILFIKLTNDNKLALKQKELISAGSIIFQVNPIGNNNLEIINLSCKKSSPNYKQTFDGYNKKVVTIGRHKECDFFFLKDKSFSRYQTSFEFDENKKEWYIIDGKDNKGSTNGTWIFGTHSFLIKKEMIAEILNSKIKIKEIKNDNLDNV